MQQHQLSRKDFPHRRNFEFWQISLAFLTRNSRRNSRHLAPPTSLQGAFWSGQHRTCVGNKEIPWLAVNKTWAFERRLLSCVRKIYCIGDLPQLLDRSHNRSHSLCHCGSSREELLDAEADQMHHRGCSPRVPFRLGPPLVCGSDGERLACFWKSLETLLLSSQGFFLAVRILTLEEMLKWLDFCCNLLTWCMFFC